MRLFRVISLATIAIGSLVSAGVSSAMADTFHNTFLGPGVQVSPDSNYVETFTNFNGTTTNFNGSPINGTYSGSFTISDPTQYGAAGGVGKVITTGGSATLTLDTHVNYFGMWFSALDQGNQLFFYDDSTLVFTFTPSAYAQLVGACPTNDPEPNYCGNPNPAFYNQDAGEQFAFLNFFDTDGTFNKIVFTENPVVGAFESDNHTVAVLDHDPTGTPLGAVPEPSTFVLGISGLAGLVGSRRQLLSLRRRRA